MTTAARRCDGLTAGRVHDGVREADRDRANRPPPAGDVGIGEPTQLGYSGCVRQAGGYPGAKWTAGGAAARCPLCL